MHNTLFMHVLKRACNLTNVFPYPFLGKTDVLLNVALHDLLQVAFFRPFDSDKELIQLVVDEPVQVLHDVGMV